MKKHQLFNSLILFFVMTFSVFFTFISCSGMTEQKTVENKKVILRFSVTNADRTVFPELADINELKDIYLYEKDSLGIYKNYQSIQELQGDIIAFDESEINLNKEYSFCLEAKKGTVSYSATLNTTISLGDNLLSFELKRLSLGKGFGNVAMDINFSDAINCESVDHVDIIVRTLNSDTITKTYENVYKNEDGGSYSVHFEAQNLTSGGYDVEVKFYASSDNRALMLTYPFVLNVADSLTSRGTILIDKLNPVYNITFDMGVNDDSEIVFDIEKNSKITRYTRVMPDEPVRSGFVFLGWYEQDGNGNEKLMNFPVSSDITLHAKWMEVESSDGVYYATKGTVANIISSVTSGSETNPAIIKMAGIFDGETLDIINDALQAKYSNNSQVYFELDLTGVTETEYIDNHALRSCNNIVKIDLYSWFDCNDSNPFIYCSSLKEISLIPDTEHDSNCFVDNGVLYKKINNTEYSEGAAVLLTYPIGSKTLNFTIPENVVVIGEYAFYGSMLEEITLSVSVQNIGELSFGSCYHLEDISVPDGSLFFADEDGVLYSADKTLLVHYPAGSEANTFEIPQTVSVIKAYAFEGASELLSVTFEKTGGAWFINEGKWEMDLARILEQCQKADFDLPSTTAQVLKTNYQYYYSHVFITKDGTLTIKDYDVPDSDYTALARVDGHDPVYELQTVTGKTYVISFIKSGDNVSILPYSVVVDKNYSGIETRYSGQYSDSCLFTATADSVYICFSLWDDSDWSVRVCEEPGFPVGLNLTINKPDISLSYNDKLTGYDFMVNTSSVFDEYIHKRIEYCWYVDLEPIAEDINNRNGFGFMLSDYSSGIHLITVEVVVIKDEESNPEYYSASTQVVVK